MIDTVIQGLVSSLKAQGLCVFSEYPDRLFEKNSEGFVVVGAESWKSLSPGIGEYLGLRLSEEGSVYKEIYGKRLEISLYLDVYSFFKSAQGHKGLSDYTQALARCLESLPSGIRTKEIEFGEVTADDELMAFRQKCRLHCTAFLIAEATEADNEFLDFILKGTVTDAY